MSETEIIPQEQLVSKCEDCKEADPVIIASCPHCGKAVCDGCFMAYHENRKCRQGE